jgi:hypothetical protein
MSPEVAHHDISLAATFGRYRGIADMAGLAAGSPRSRMTRADIVDGKLVLLAVAGIVDSKVIPSAPKQRRNCRRE